MSFFLKVHQILAASFFFSKDGKGRNEAGRVAGYAPTVSPKGWEEMVDASEDEKKLNFFREKHHACTSRD